MKLNFRHAWNRLGKKAQFLLDRLYYAREWAGTSTAFLAIRLTAIEVSWSDIKKKTYPPHAPALSSASAITDLAGMLEAAKDVLKAADGRRGAIVDKGKTLVTLCGLFIALLGFLLPKEFGVPGGIARVAMLISIGLFTLCLVLLLSFFDIGADATPGVSGAVGLSQDEQKRALILAYCEVASNLQGRSDYLADVYRTARFYFYAAFLTAIGVVVINFYASPADQTEKIIQALRADPKLMKLLKGPPGDRGAPGATGAKGEFTPKDKAEIAQAVIRTLKDGIRKDAATTESGLRQTTRADRVGEG